MSDFAHVMVFCPKCEHGFITMAEDGVVDEEFVNCEFCKWPNKVIPADEVTDPVVIIDMIESELEDANHHSRVSQPRQLYDLLLSVGPQDDATKLHYARSIRKVMEPR